MAAMGRAFPSIYPVELAPKRSPVSGNVISNRMKSRVLSPGAISRGSDIFSMPPSLLSVYAADLPSAPTEPMAMQLASTSFACRRSTTL